MAIAVLAHERVVVVGGMLAVNRDGRHHRKRVILHLRVVEAVVGGRSDVALHVARAPHRHRVDLATPTGFGHVVSLHVVRHELNLAGRGAKRAFAALYHRLERVVRHIDFRAHNRVCIELFPGRTLFVTEIRHNGLVVRPVLEGLLIDRLLRVDPVLGVDVEHAGVVLVGHAQALGNLRPDPLLRADFARELQTACAEREVVAHAVRARHEALMPVHVLVHALELPDGSRQNDVAQLGGRLV